MATPLHTKAAEYQKRGLFLGVRHFFELELRIEALSDERQRGDAFEIFTEAYLATQRPHDAHALWPQSAAPVAVLQSLGLTVQDNGVVRQTLHEWLHETRWSKLAYLCVCSDPTVTSDIDSLSVQQTDLDYEVNTDSKTVRAFLDADFQGPRLVFCTYTDRRN